VRIGVCKNLGIDVDDDLVALARSAGIDAVVERRLGEQRQRVGLLLLHRRWVGLRTLVTSLLMQHLASGGKRLEEQCADLR